MPAFLLLPLLLLLSLLSGPSHRRIVGGAAVAPTALAIDDDTIIGRGHFVHDWPAENPDGSVNAVIEIPSGTTGKLEVDEVDGKMHWRRDRDHGGRREVDYLPFPVNYGMVPRTLSDDGDPLDIIVLGRGFERAHVAEVRVIGVLAMADEGGRDDKLITVPLEPALANGFTRLHELGELDELYPALRTIVTLYFTHYWGEGRTEVLGWADVDEAELVLERAKLRYSVAHATATAVQ